jgi:hypothetical protein
VSHTASIDSTLRGSGLILFDRTTSFARASALFKLHPNGTIATGFPLPLKVEGYVVTSGSHFGCMIEILFKLRKLAPKLL